MNSPVSQSLEISRLLELSIFVWIQDIRAFPQSQSKRPYGQGFEKSVELLGNELDEKCSSQTGFAQSKAIICIDCGLQQLQAQATYSPVYICQL